MSGPGRDGFFIGWSPQLPPGLGRFLAVVAAGLLGGLALAALALSASVDDPGGGDFDWPGGERSLRGVLTAAPYPLLHLAPSAAHPRGHAVMLAGLGKTGLEVDPALEGRAVEATGLPLRRGTLDMLAKVSDAPSLRPVEGAAAAPPSPVPLGRWRITGEICDGKCRTGAMRPGSGIAHRA